MSVPETVQDYLREQNLGSVTRTQSVGGGCINNGMRIWTEAGGSFFLKTNSSAPRDMFAREAEGLRALQVPEGPRVPEVFFYTPSALLLEDLNPQGKMSNYWVHLGHQLAALHQSTRDRFGFPHNNYIGSIPQPNPQEADGFKFFAEHRLMFQAELAHKNGYFSSREIALVEQLAARLKALIPEQPASILHGDLWSGNIISDEEGAPAIIDPAAYYGWAEADLAMMTLFGAPPDSFFRAYSEKGTLAPRYRERFPIYNLYHLMNHLNLFGRGYYAQVMSVLNRFG